MAVREPLVCTLNFNFVGEKLDFHLDSLGIMLDVELTGLEVRLVHNTVVVEDVERSTGVFLVFEGSM